MIYVIGSMRNPAIPDIGNHLRQAGYEVFDDWFAPGPEADDYWQTYAKQRRQSYQEALNDHHARHVFDFDKYHLDRAEGAVLVMPAGRSAHLELGYMAGKGKYTAIFFPAEPDRYDIMTRLATVIVFSLDELVDSLLNHGVLQDGRKYIEKEI